MMTVPSFDFASKTTAETELPAKLFGVKFIPSVIYHLVVGYQANQRQFTRQVKNRSDIRGGGRKPWKQKGTGRARQGSIRAPQWRGGGVVFGPQAEQRPHFKINRRTYRTGLKMVLTAQAEQRQLSIISNLTCLTAKTKELKAMLATHPSPILTVKSLLVADHWPIGVLRAAANLSHLVLTTADQVNPYQLLNHSNILLTQSAISILMERVK